MPLIFTNVSFALIRAISGLPFFFLILTNSVSAQHLPTGQAGVFIYIKDNINHQFNNIEYFIRNDSLIIRAASDFGRTKVNYLERKLKKDERKAIASFMKSFPMDSLRENYFDEFNSFGYIAADHFPRVIDAEIKIGDIQKKVKATNVYVILLSRMIDFLNTYFPSETRIKFVQADFKASY